jgi:hypothetical protein
LSLLDEIYVYSNKNDKSENKEQKISPYEDKTNGCSLFIKVNFVPCDQGLAIFQMFAESIWVCLNCEKGLMFFQIFAEQIWMGLALVIPCDQG